MNRSCNESPVVARVAVVVLCLIAAGSTQALTTFTAGTPARADEVNANFAEIAERITDLEARHTAATVTVDCTVDAGALGALGSVAEYTTVVISGTCSGPIRVDRQGVILEAATPGVDGIEAPGVGPQVLIITASNVSVSGLLVSATQPSGSTGVLFFNGGSGTLDNLYVTGAEVAVVVGRAGAVRIQNTKNINVIRAVDGSFARIEGGNGGFSLGAYRNGSIQLRDTAAGSTFTGIQAADNGMIRTHGANTVITVDGQVAVRRTSSAYFEGPLTINHQTNGDGDGLQVMENSSLRVVNATINAHTQCADSSSIRAAGTNFIDPEDSNRGASITVSRSSALVLENTSSAGFISVESNSSLQLDTSMLSGDPVRQDALQLVTGGICLAQDSQISQAVSVDLGSILELSGSTLNGDLEVWGAVIARNGASINATSATDGTCPADFSEGIRLNGGSLGLSDDSSISGYIQLTRGAAFIANPRDFAGTLDSDQGSIFDMLVEHAGINVCTW